MASAAAVTRFEAQQAGQLHVYGIHACVRYTCMWCHFDCVVLICSFVSGSKSTNPSPVSVRKKRGHRRTGSLHTTLDHDSGQSAIPLGGDVISRSTSSDRLALSEMKRSTVSCKLKQQIHMHDHQPKNECSIPRGWLLFASHFN